MQSYTQQKKSTKISPAITKYKNRIICGEALKVLKRLPDDSIDCVVTSPPYWALRDYGVDGQIGLEQNIEDYLNKILAVFSEVHRVLKSAGTVWVNFGDTYANKTKGGYRSKPQGNIYDPLSKRMSFPKMKLSDQIPPKSLCLIPSRFALRMIEEGWILRNEIIWHKPNAMPHSVKDRFTVDFEKIFFFVKEKKYYFRQQYEALKNPARLERRLLDPHKAHKYTKSYWFSSRPVIAEKQRLKMLERGRNKRCVWSIGTTSFIGDHFATYPERLIQTPISAGCPEDGIVLDPFMGSGTTAVVARKLKRNYIGIELKKEYVKLAAHRLQTIK